LSLRKPPPNAAQLFDPTLVPLFSRLHAATATELKMRALTMAGFGGTFYCIIQGMQSLSATLGAAGVSSGVPFRELGVLRFFCAQGVGVLVEQG
ncbi:hypothetical protein K458DRAFT_259394, partial [Lentithecium fluviatile CBS 122367]